MNIKNVDSLMPSEMAVQAELVGVSKANMSVSKTLVLAMLAGAFIAFGSIFFTTVTAGSTLPYGITRLIGGISFSLGLVLVIVGGAELFTGNNLIVMAWANKKISTSQILKNWALVYVGNMTGALFVAVLLFFSGQYLFASGMVGINILNIAKAKCELGFTQAVTLGILCNILVCLAVWLCFSSQSVSGKILSIVFPITAFVASGFEHSIANMYFIPEAILVLNHGDTKFLSLANTSAQNYESITWSNYLLHNLIPVTIGNIIGGAVLVGLVYWFVFLRKSKE
ncbi:formate transporter FocA [Flavobacterium maritimum]|jgi:formate transporter FocA|uniref:formate transporter FocA n=1 Tax=Flavobacterium maritimum TaxID=3149042 RepID=UPI0032B46AE3